MDTASEIMHQTLLCPDGSELAYHFLPGTTPGVIFLGGFRSNMMGTKATYLEDLCRKLGCSYIRFDYFAHGASTGDFTQATLSRWKEDVLLILDKLTAGPQILVGSSMGGWLMLLATLERPERIQALIGIAAAPDFVDDFDRLTAQQQKDLATHGFCTIPGYKEEESYSLVQNFIDDAKTHRVLQDKIAIQCPVRLIHGIDDKEVPWRQSLRLMEHLTSSDATLTLVKEAGHRLSRDKDLEILGQQLRMLLG